MLHAPEALKRVCQRVKPGVHRRARRDAHAQLRIDYRGERHESGIVYRLLLRAVAYDRHLSDLTAGARRGRHCDDGQTLCREGARTAVVFYRIAAVERYRGGKLGRVNRAAAADADYRVGSVLAGELYGFFNSGELRILLHAAEHGAQLVHRGDELLGLRCEVPPADDDAAMQTELRQHIVQPCEFSRAEEYLHRLGVDKITYHKPCPR